MERENNSSGTPSSALRTPKFVQRCQTWSGNDDYLARDERKALSLNNARRAQRSHCLRDLRTFLFKCVAFVITPRPALAVLGRVGEAGYW